MKTTTKINALTVLIGKGTALLQLKIFLLPVWKMLTTGPCESIIPASCICIGIDKGNMQILHAARTFSRYQIKTHKTHKLETDFFPSPEDVASETAVFLKNLRIRNAEVILVVPKSWVIVTQSGFPSAVAENLHEVIAYELDRITPLSPDEALYDFLAEKETPVNLSIFIAAAKAVRINSYITSLFDREIKVSKVAFDLSSTSTLFRFMTGQNDFNFFDVNAGQLHCGSVRRGILRHALSTEFKKDDHMNKVEIIENFLDEQKLFTDTEMQLIASFDKGSASVIELLKSRDKISFKIMDGMERKIGGIGSGSSNISNSIAGAAMEYLWPGSRGFDLLSKGRRSVIKKPFFLTVSLLLILAVCLAMYVFIPIETEKERLEEIEKQINLRKAEVKNVEKINSDIEVVSRQMSLVDSFKHGMPSCIDLIKAMTIAVPKNTWLTRLRIAGPQVSIEGYAPSATPLIQLIEASEYFQRVEFASPTFRDVRLNMDRFQIKMEIENQKPEAGNENK